MPGRRKLIASSTSSSVRHVELVGQRFAQHALLVELVLHRDRRRRLGRERHRGLAAQRLRGADGAREQVLVGQRASSAPRPARPPRRPRARAVSASERCTCFRSERVLRRGLAACLDVRQSARSRSSSMRTGLTRRCEVPAQVAILQRSRAGPARPSTGAARGHDHMVEHPHVDQRQRGLAGSASATRPRARARRSRSDGCAASTTAAAWWCRARITTSRG